MSGFANSFFNNMAEGEVATFLPLTNSVPHITTSHHQPPNENRLFNEPFQVVHHHVMAEENDGRLARPIIK